MAITVEIVINDCSDCRHQSHSGGFTKPRPRKICGHPCASKHFGNRFHKDSSHWRNRLIEEKDSYSPSKLLKEPPKGCPLRHGEEY